MILGVQDIHLLKKSVHFCASPGKLTVDCTLECFDFLDTFCKVLTSSLVDCSHKYDINQGVMVGGRRPSKEDNLR